MRVFISWSGERSKVVAEVLRDRLRLVLQTCEPWMSETDILPGQRWSETLGTTLAESDVGVLCLTPENLASAWLLFEAGALAKAVDRSSVIPVLIDVMPSQLPAPLGIFQSVTLSKESVFRKDGVYRLLDTLRKADKEVRLSEAELKEIFDAMWPAIEQRLLSVSDIVQEGTQKQNAPEFGSKSDREILEELLELTKAGREPSKNGLVEILRAWRSRLSAEANRLNQIDFEKHSAAASAASNLFEDWADRVEEAVKLVEGAPWK